MGVWMRGGMGAKGKRLTNIAYFEKERSFRGDNGKNAIEDRPFFWRAGGRAFLNKYSRGERVE